MLASILASGLAAGAVYALAFLTFYAYFSRVELARALVAESAA